MANWRVGDTVIDYITLTDTVGDVISGAAWVVTDTVDPIGGDFTLSISEVESGTYKVSFIPSIAGRYYWSVRTTSLVPNQAFEQEFYVSITDNISVGSVAVDYITITDANGDPITDVSWVTLESIDPDGSSFSLSITEVGGGVYKIQFTTTKAGSYYWVIETEGLDPEQAFESFFTAKASSSATSGVVTDGAVEGVTLIELVRKVATRMGDLKKIVATADGAEDGSSFVDNNRLRAIPADALKGSELVFISPSESSNYQLQTAVTRFSEDFSTLTLAPLAQQVAVGDQAYLLNLYSDGNYYLDYVDAINSAIGDSYPGHLVPLTYIPTDDDDVFIPFDPSSPWISVPTSVKKLYALEVYQSDDEQHAYLIPFSFQNRPDLPGWWWDVSQRRVVINEPYRGGIDGFVTRFKGYGRPSQLTNFTDVTTVDAGWIVYMATETLKMATGDQRELAAASMNRSIAENYLGKSVVIPVPGTIDLGH